MIALSLIAIIFFRPNTKLSCSCLHVSEKWYLGEYLEVTQHFSVYSGQDIREARKEKNVHLNNTLISSFVSSSSADSIESPVNAGFFGMVG